MHTNIRKLESGSTRKKFFFYWICVYIKAKIVSPLA